MINSCPLCRNRNLKKIYSINDMPIFQNKVYDTLELAKNVKTYTLYLVECENCSFMI